jgi:ubiquinone/menaquinone biosynthesis C-methylase UbiE
VKPYNDTLRRTWQDPEHILTKVGLRSGFTFIDVGCGDGFFTLPAAKKVGNTGCVYGIDRNEFAINSLREKAAREQLDWVSLEIGKAEDIVICTACADIVFFGIVLHDFEDPMKVLLNARKMLKPSGRLINLDWKKEPMVLGPPLRIRFSKEQTLRLLTKANFKIEHLSDTGSYHYLVIAKL